MREKVRTRSLLGAGVGGQLLSLIGFGGWGWYKEAGMGAGVVELGPVPPCCHAFSLLIMNVFFMSLYIYQLIEPILL
jgi:hypothetical protein